MSGLFDRSQKKPKDNRFTGTNQETLLDKNPDKNTKKNTNKKQYLITTEVRFINYCNFNRMWKNQIKVEWSILIKNQTMM